MIFQIKIFVAEGFSYQHTCVRFLTLQIFKLFCFSFQKALLISQACSSLLTAKNTEAHIFFVILCSVLSLPSSLPPSPLALSLLHSLRSCSFFLPEFKCAFSSPLIQSQGSPKRDVSSELQIYEGTSSLSFSESQLEINSFFFSCQFYPQSFVSY